jgi:hypothetical protein
MSINPSFYTAAQLATAKAIYDAFNGWKTSHGTFSPHHAAAIVEQADAESSFSATALGDRGTAFGLLQWHSARASQIYTGTGINVTAFPPVAKQIQAAQWELVHTSYANTALTRILAAADAYDAGVAACVYFEQAGAPGQPAKRGAGATAWASYFMQQHGD